MTRGWVQVRQTAARIGLLCVLAGTMIAVAITSFWLTFILVFTVLL